MEEVIQETPEQHQTQVDKTKEALLASIRLKNPKLYYKLVHPEGYKPWRREDYKNSDIKVAVETEARSAPHARKIYRNELCGCGSGQKIKYCCGIKTYYTIPKVVTNE
jgi:tRNA-binding EMAP/Myf-like protein